MNHLPIRSKWSFLLTLSAWIDAFELWCWRRLLWDPWNARRSNQSWIFIGRTDAETETTIPWPHDAREWLIRKDPDPGKDWRQEKGTTEDEMVGWHHQLNAQEFVTSSGSWWWTGKPGVHGVAKSQHYWVTELNWSAWKRTDGTLGFEDFF